ncbi:MAG TPA: class I SAM-dependent methyltransferase [Acidobacteriaceae bacterium]|jgi:23S rRNA (cytosine1962-C5)-methyltransferase|nr:class I SAM-dependent methyltransferase [Acidobacteriaceae bacterium]
MPTPPKKKLTGKPPSPYAAKPTPSQPREKAMSEPVAKPKAAGKPAQQQLRQKQSPQQPSPNVPRPAPATPANTPYGARISRRASDRLRAGHLWVYSTDIESINASDSDILIPVADNRGLLLGTALYSPTSQITLRMVAREAIDQAQWLELLASRLRTAIEHRLPFLHTNKRGSDSSRLCFSEADELPGLVVDKYGDLIVLQLLAKGLDTSAVRQTAVDVLRSYSKFFQPAAIWERPDPRIRELEGLSELDPEPLYAANPESPLTATTFKLNGLKFLYSVNSGQKTGAFLDQHDNYRAAKEYAWLLAPGGRALDVCTYQGGFALHLAQVSKHVTAIDASRASLETAEQNLIANRDVLGDKEIDWVCGDAFNILREWAGAREQFDSIVLDPPAFAKSKRAVEGALRGYKELNLRALQMIRPGGLLITCSCSHHVSGSDLEGAVASAAVDANRRVTLLERRGAAQDHPVVLNLPETEYLKCLICQVD